MKRRRRLRIADDFIEEMTGHHPLETDRLSGTAERIARALEKIAETNSIDQGSPISEIQFLDGEGNLVAQYEIPERNGNECMGKA